MTADRPDLSWMASGLCVGMDVDGFFPERGMPGRRQAQRAIEVCAACPVQADCLEFAIATNERYGVWGGKTERDRRRLRAEAFRQLELFPALPEPERRPAAKRRLGSAAVRRGRLRGITVEGQEALMWWIEVLDDERYGVWGTTVPASVPVDTITQHREAS
jgi:WhiB family redox-sensing transcriptional regulator